MATTGISLIGIKGSVPTDVQVTDRPGGTQWTGLARLSADEVEDDVCRRLAQEDAGHDE